MSGVGVRQSQVSTGEARFASPFAARQLVTRKVAAAILGMDIKHLELMRADGRIPSVRLANGEFRYSESDLSAYLARTH